MIPKSGNRFSEKIMRKQRPRMPSDAPPTPLHRWPRILRIVRARPRLFACIVVGIVVLIALSGHFSQAARLVIAWDVGVALYLLAAYQLIATGSERTMRRLAALEDEGRIGVLVLTVGASLASLGAIVILLTAHDIGLSAPQKLVIAIITIVLSWAFIHTIFGLHYAHEYYGERGGNTGGLAFPGNEKPDYWDFVYFSFVIGMTSQVSDVAISSRAIRRTVLAHGIAAFLFNAALLALTVNIAASAIQPS
jgi:uncharacterized membrane protein